MLVDSRQLPLPDSDVSPDPLRMGERSREQRTFSRPDGVEDRTQSITTNKFNLSLIYKLHLIHSFPLCDRKKAIFILFMDRTGVNLGPTGKEGMTFVIKKVKCSFVLNNTRLIFVRM